MYSKVIYLEGVACLGKTALLKELDHALYTVGLFDYTEYKEITGPGGNHEDYTKWHAKNSCNIERGFVNRSPYSNKLYTLVYELLDNNMVKPDGFDKRLRDVPVVKQPSELVVIFLPGNSESYASIVTNMKRRANGIDRLDCAYVEAQTIVFSEYARINNLLVVHVNYNIPCEDDIKQYENLFSLMCALIK